MTPRDPIWRGLVFQPTNSTRRRAVVNVLIVDASRLMRELLQSALTEQGDIDVTGSAGSPYEAHSLLRATDPDVIMLEADMPGMGALEFLRRVMDRRPLPVVMVAGDASGEAALAALELGAVECVSKPAGRAGWEAFAEQARAKVSAAASIRFSRCPARSKTFFRQDTGSGPTGGAVPVRPEVRANGKSNAARQLRQFVRRE